VLPGRAGGDHQVAPLHVVLPLREPLVEERNAGGDGARAGHGATLRRDEREVRGAIVTDLAGAIDVASVVGQGSTFAIYLPRV
jgi:hypothetical protein